jgi:hypothetical protein
MGVEPGEVEARFLVSGIGAQRLLEQTAALVERARDALETTVEHVARLAPVDAADLAPAAGQDAVDEPAPARLHGADVRGLLEDARLEPGSAPAST